MSKLNKMNTHSECGWWDMFLVVVMGWNKNNTQLCGDGDDFNESCGDCCDRSFKHKAAVFQIFFHTMCHPTHLHGHFYSQHQHFGSNVKQIYCAII